MQNELNSYIDTIPKPETMEELDEYLSSKVSESFNRPREERLKRIAQSDNIPQRIKVSTHAYLRNPDVIVEVLNRANGICEKCGSIAPFQRESDDSPYLEVHHNIPLSMGGEDTVLNAIALCPNCHRFLHYGKKS